MLRLDTSMTRAGIVALSAGSGEASLCALSSSLGQLGIFGHSGLSGDSKCLGCSYM